MKKYLAFILLCFGIGCICSCTAIDEPGDTSCAPEGMIRMELPLRIASPAQTAEGATTRLWEEEWNEEWETIEDLEIELYDPDLPNVSIYTLHFDAVSLRPVTNESGAKYFFFDFDMPEIVLRDYWHGLMPSTDKRFDITARANLSYFREYGSIDITPPVSHPVYLSGTASLHWHPTTKTFEAECMYLLRSICKLRTVVRTAYGSQLGDWEAYLEKTEVQLLHAPTYARRFLSGPNLTDFEYVDPTADQYVNYYPMKLEDFPSDQIVNLTLHDRYGPPSVVNAYEQYFFENCRKDVSGYKEGVNTTSLKVKIPLHNNDTGEDKFIERVIPISADGDTEITSQYDYWLMRNTVFLLDIQVLDAEDIEVNLHLQDWWKEVPVNGDIPGESFTVDKTEVPVIPYGVTDPAPAFTVTAKGRPGSMLDISLVDRNKAKVDQNNGFALWHRQGDGSLTKAPADNHITYDLNSDLKVQVAFSTTKNGNTGGFFKVSCGKSVRYIPISTPRYVRADEMFNKTMTSNCYIAEKQGGYRFAGTVMGNGTDGLPPTIQVSMKPYNANGYLTGTPLRPAIAPKSAKLLWQDVDGLITQVGFDTNVTSRGDVVFYVSSAKGSGNAVISVYDTADPNDPSAKVLWSWHIWCTPRPEEMSTSGSVAAEEGGKRIYTFMDRNLGATTAEGSNKGAKGLVYRYGRSVPMIHFNKERIFNILGTDITNLIAWGEGPDGNNRTGRNWDNILFPLHYYTNAGSNYEFGMWGEGSLELVGTFDDKSIYDPCPPGYKVPAYRAFEALDELYYRQGKFRQESSGIYFTGLRGGTLCFPWVNYLCGDPGTKGQWMDGADKLLVYYSTSIKSPSIGNDPALIYTLFYWNSTGSLPAVMNQKQMRSTSLLPIRCVREREKK